MDNVHIKMDTTIPLGSMLVTVVISFTIWLNSTHPAPAPDSLGLDELWQKRDGSKF